MIDSVLCRLLQVIKGFAAKSDGKDKLTALVQVRFSTQMATRSNGSLLSVDLQLLCHLVDSLSSGTRCPVLCRCNCSPPPWGRCNR